MNFEAVTPSVASQKVRSVLCMVCDYLVVVSKELCISSKSASDCVKLEYEWLNFSKQLSVTILWDEHRLLILCFVFGLFVLLFIFLFIQT